MVGADIAFAALNIEAAPVVRAIGQAADHPGLGEKANLRALRRRFAHRTRFVAGNDGRARVAEQVYLHPADRAAGVLDLAPVRIDFDDFDREVRSEEHTSELQSLMRISYA